MLEYGGPHQVCLLLFLPTLSCRYICSMAATGTAEHEEGRLCTHMQAAGTACTLDGDPEARQTGRSFIYHDLPCSFA
ncbi:hypothetical protein F5Y10DRAFT_138382 [Nemania abortiva]|nr:hypothetical protein F5Y10DRAFT_138382 [Nemania abortiva]